MIADFDKLLQPGESNALGQGVGLLVPDWRQPPWPPREALAGQYVCVEPLDAARHGRDLYEALHQDATGANWTYSSYGPFADWDSWLAKITQYCASRDPHFYAIVDAGSGRAIGWASYLRIVPEDGCIEVGHLNFSPRLQRTRLATEAMYLLMRQAFALGYRRYEWKCDAQNTPSVNAALRLGFTFEGLFRQARLNRGRNRDTAWFSILDHEWPARRAALEAWLAADNFDAAGLQRQSLAALRG